MNRKENNVRSEDSKKTNIQEEIISYTIVTRFKPKSEEECNRLTTENTRKRSTNLDTDRWRQIDELIGKRDIRVVNTPSAWQGRNRMQVM